MWISRTQIEGSSVAEYSCLSVATGILPISSVAGAYAPAFVERRSLSPFTSSRGRSVAGAYAPAFVERRRHAERRG